MRRVILISLALQSIALFGATAFGADMLSGTWKLNVAKSSVNSGPIPPAVMITETIKAVANGITVISDSTSPSGQKSRSEFTVIFDGKNYPTKYLLDGEVDFKAGDMVSATKTDDFTLELKFTANDKVTSLVKDVVSKDGKTRTSTTTVTNPSGQSITRILVYEKQ